MAQQRRDRLTPPSLSLGGHVGGGRLGLGAVPGGVEAAGGDVTGVVPGGGVPDDRQGLADQRERQGAADRAGDPVAGLPGAEYLLRVFYRDLDGPSRGVALDDLSGAGVQVGGDQGEVEAAGGGVADEDDLDLLRAEDGVPQAGQGRQPARWRPAGPG